jgi:Uma2 family endonuclease
MTAEADIKKLITVEEYLEGEVLSEIKHEYLAGQVYAMSGASARHGLIVTALAALLHPLARKHRCQLFIADMKMRIDEGEDTYFYYPDLILCCDPNDRESAYYRRNPCLIVEVASPSTERIDRREKRLAYRIIPSLREYLIIAQEKRHIDLYRHPKAEHATHTTGSFWLDCLNTEIAIDDIYADVED